MYRRVVTHYDRCAILFIVDCSLSMRNLTRFGTTEMSKIEVASLIVNHMIDDLVARATRGINVRDYYDIGVIGYSGYEAYSMLPGDDTVFKRVVRLVEDSPQPKYVYLNCQSVDGDIRSMPYLIHPWIEPEASGASPMYDAFTMARNVAKQWCNDPRNKTSFPPLIFHISDGLPSDADDVELRAIAEEIMALGMPKGKSLLFNIYLATADEGDLSIEIYPESRLFYPYDSEREFTFTLSSFLPEHLESYVFRTLRPNTRPPYRATAFNTSPISLLSIINVGTMLYEPFVPVKY